MERTNDVAAPDSPVAMARIVATLLARDGRVDWREMDFIDRSGALRLMGVKRREFVAILAEALRQRGSCRSDGGAAVGALLDSIRARRLQLVVAALLVYIAEIDRAVGAAESSLVRRAFAQWGVTPADLQQGMGVPLDRCRAALYGLREAA